MMLPAHAASSNTPQAPGTAGTSEAEVQASLQRQAVDLPAGDGQIFKILGGVEYRRLAIADEDPRNDMSLSWKLGATVKLFEGGSFFLGTRLNQHFVAEEGESGFRLADTVAGLNYFQTLSTDFGQSIAKEVYAKQTALVYLPTSRDSSNQDMRFALQLQTEELIALTPDLLMGFDGMVQYRNHQYAERAGLHGGMNTKYAARTGVLVEYALPLSDLMDGRLAMGLYGSTTWRNRYLSIDEHVSNTSSAALWLQDYGWEAYIEYTPVPSLTVALSAEQGGNVLRSGIVNTFFAHRDETDVVLRLTGRY